MPVSYEIPNVGIYEFPDDMSEEDIFAEINNIIVPNADFDNPDPEQVRNAPHLFPDIDRGSLFGGLGSGVERLGRAPEAVAAAVGRSQEELEDLKAQMAEEEYEQRYRASLGDVTGQWERGDYLGAAGTLFGDVLPQTLGESLPDMAVIGGGVWAGAKVGAAAGVAAGAATGPLAWASVPVFTVAGATIGAAVTGLPTFFGMNVERQIQENEITDPDEIKTLQAASVAALQGGLEGLIYPVLGFIPGIRGLAAPAVRELVEGGAKKLSLRQGARIVAQHAGAGGATEAITEVGQQMLERAQAGLEVTHPEALKEYVEAAVLGGLLGVGFGTGAGGYQTYKTSKGIRETNAALDQIEAEMAEAARQNWEQQRQIYTDPETGEKHPLIIDPARLLPSPTSRNKYAYDGPDPDNNTADRLHATLAQNQKEEDWQRAKDLNELDRAADPHDRKLNRKQKDTAHLLNLARQSLKTEKFSPQELEDTPNIAKAVVEYATDDANAGELAILEREGDYTAEQNTYSLAALERIGRVRGVDPQVLADELLQLRNGRFPESRQISEREILDLAQSKNIRTGNRSFDAVVRRITGAASLKEASAFERILLADTLTRLKPYNVLTDPFPVREENYLYEQYAQAEQMVLDTGLFDLEKTMTETGTDEKTAIEMRDKMVRQGLVRLKRGKKKKDNIYRSTLWNYADARTDKDGNKVLPKWVDTTAKAPKTDVPLPAGPAPPIGIEGAPITRYEARTTPSGGAVVVAVGESRTDPEGAPGTAVVEHMGERVISTHGTLEEAEISAEAYQEAPASTTKRLWNQDKQDYVDIEVETTDADLRGIAVTPEQYTEVLRQRTEAAPLVTGPVRERILTALSEPHKRRQLQAAGVKIELVDSVKDALSATRGVAREAPGAVDRTEGAYVSGLIYLGLDIAGEYADHEGAKRGSPLNEVEREEAIIRRLAEVLSHEQIHALIYAEILGPADFSVLARYATTKARPAKFRMVQDKGAKWTYLDDVQEIQRDLNEEALQEEAVAEMFRDWARDRKSVTGRPASLFRRIVKFITTLGGFFKENGAQRVDDIFGRLDEGTLREELPTPQWREAADADRAARSVVPDLDNAPKYSVGDTVAAYYHSTTRSMNEITRWGKRSARGKGAPFAFHMGTKAAALDRAIDKREPLGWQVGAQFGMLIDALREKVFKIHVTPKNPLGSPQEPIDEKAKEGEIIKRPEDLISNGYDAVFYINRFEDPGSVSLLVVDPAIIEVVDTYTGPITEMDPKFSVMGDRFGMPPRPEWDRLRGHGIAANIEWPEGLDEAVLNLWIGGKEKGELVEVRGNRMLGSKYLGDPLDRIFNSIPRTANISELMTGNDVSMSAEMAAPVIDALEFEDQLRDRLAENLLGPRFSVSRIYGTNNAMVPDSIKKAYDRTVATQEKLRAFQTEYDVPGEGVRVSTSNRQQEAANTRAEAALGRAIREALPGASSQTNINLRRALQDNNPTFEIAEEDSAKLSLAENLLDEPKFAIAPPIDSAEFKNFFRRSVIITEDGTPRLMYHGGADPIIDFEPQDRVARGQAKLAGFYFIGYRKQAEGYAKHAEERRAETRTGPAGPGAVTSGYLRMENPFKTVEGSPLPNDAAFAALLKALEAVGPADWAGNKVDTVNSTRSFHGVMIDAGVDGRVQQDVLKAGGYDGMIDGADHVVFDNDQIRVTSAPGRRDVDNIFQKTASLGERLDVKDPAEDPRIRKRYAVKVRRAGKSTITRWFFATTLVEARTRAANSPNINRGGFEISEPYLDDPTLEDDVNKAPSFSIRSIIRDIDTKAQPTAAQNALQIIMPSFREERRGVAWFAGNPLPITLFNGTQLPDGRGFGKLHIEHSADRFGGKPAMRQMLKKMMVGTFEENNPDYQIVPYKEPGAPTYQPQDHRMLWTDPDTKQPYALGLELYRIQGIDHAAVTTFFPDTKVDIRPAPLTGKHATNDEILEYMKEQEARRKKVKKSMAPRDALGFYSEAERAVDQFKEDSATGKQWKKWLWDRAKPKELNTVVGLEEMLGSVEGRVSKDEMRAFLQQNGIVLGETALDQEPTNMPDEAIEETDRGFIIYYQGDELGVFPTRAEAESELDYQNAALDTGRDPARQPIFSEYTLPGGVNNREFYIVLPHALGGNKQIKSWLLPPGHRTGIGIIDQRMIVRIRVNDRMIDGKRMLFIEEIQGDRQDAASKAGGFIDDNVNERIDVLTKAIARQSDTLHAFTAADRIGDGAFNRVEAEAMGERLDELVVARQSLIDEQDSAVARIPWESDNEWGRLALKRLLMRSLEEGYDAVAWTTGQTQLDRYPGVQKRISEIHLTPSMDLTAYNAGGQVTISQTGVSPSDLQKMFGKEIADRLMEAPVSGRSDPVTGASISPFQSLQNLDLKIGGKGLEDFYDTTIPNILSKIMGKAVRGEVDKSLMAIPSSTSQFYPEIADIDRSDEVLVHTFTMPETMREKVREEGFPKFSVAQDLLSFIKDHPDGFTVSVDGKTVPASGYAFAPVKGAEIVVSDDDLNLDVVDDLTRNIKTIMDITGADVYAGGWRNPDNNMYYLDASMVFDNYEQTLYAADAAEQIAIFDVGEFNDIRTQEGIAKLKETGAYSAKAHNDARRNQTKLARRFQSERDQGPPEPEEPSYSIGQPLDITPTGARDRITIKDISSALDAAHKREFGRALNPENPQDRLLILDQLLADFDEQMGTRTTGLEWYTTDIKKAFKISKRIIPELRQQKHRDTFLAVAALMSPQTKADENWNNAIDVMQGYLKTGKFPLKRANGNLWGVPGIQSGLQLFQRLTDQYGATGAVRWLKTPHTAMEIAQFRQDSGLFVTHTTNKKTGEKTLKKTWDYAANETRQSDNPIGFYMMGPKVGDFFMNATGFDNDAVTVDVWMLRTYNRVIGRLPELGVEANVRGRRERDNIKNLIRDVAGQRGVTPSAAQALLWFYEQRLFKGYGAKSENRTFSKGAAQAAQSRNVPHTLSGRVAKSVGGPRLPASVERGGRRDAGVAQETRLSIAPPRRPVQTHAEKQPSAAPMNVVLADENPNIWRRLKKESKKQLAPGGLLHEIAYALKVKRDGYFNDMSSVSQWTLTEFNRAHKAVYGKRVMQMDEAHMARMNDMLHGGVIPAELPERIKTAIIRMRSDIDGLSTEYIKIIQEDVAKLRAEGKEAAALRAEMLEQIFINNMGEYVTRSYEVFDDPNWYRRIPPEVQAAAMAHLTRQYDGDELKAAQVYSVITQGKTTAFSNMESFIKESTLGAKDLSVLMKRGNIDPEIRALMGEYTDPQINYARSMLKMSRLIGNTHFLNEVLEKGQDLFLFDEANRPPAANHQMAGPNSDVLSPLNGKWVHPETKQAFEDALHKNSLNGWVTGIIGVNGIVKWGKIVLSPATQTRNFVSNVSNLTATGSFKPDAVPVAWNAMRSYMLTLDGGARDYYRELVRLGVMLDTPNAGQLQDLMEHGGDRVLGAIELGLKGAAATVGFDGSLDLTFERIRDTKAILDKLYRAGDEFWKIIGFESQLADLMDAKGWTREQAAPEAARRVRATMFTYSQTGSGMKVLGRMPILGPFVSFSSESVRSTIEGIKLVQSDWADPDLKHLAIRRAVGLTLAHSWVFGLAAISRAAFSVDDDEAESLRQLGSPWAENSNIMVVGRDEEGRPVTLDLSYIDMFNIWHRPLVAIFRGQDVDKTLRDVVKEIGKPFFGPDIAIQNVSEIVLNQKLSGGRVRNPDAPVDDQVRDIGEHMYKGLGPGIAQNYSRVKKALLGKRSPSGRIYELPLEIMATFGLRVTKFDPKIALNFRVNDFKNDLKNANAFLYDVAGDMDPRSEKELVDAFNAANDIRLQAYRDFQELVEAARKSGLNDRDINEVLRSANVSKAYAHALARGRDAPKWRLGTTFMKGNIKRARILIDREIAQELQQRRLFLRRASPELQVSP